MLSVQNINFSKNQQNKQLKLGFKGLSKNITKSAFQTECEIRQALSDAASGDTPVLKKVKKGLINRLVKKLVTEPDKAITAGITARSGGGKTTLLVDAIKNMLGIKPEDSHIPHNPFVTIINGDNWYKDLSKELKEAGNFMDLLKKGHNFDVPEAVNLKNLRETMKKLGEGESLMGPEYIFATCENIPGRIHLNPAKLIVTDSIFALHPKFNLPEKPVLDFGMYVDVSKDELRRRMLIRAESRGNDPQTALNLFEIANREADKHLHPNIGDIVINGEQPRELVAAKMSKFFKAITGKRD